jgi:flagellar motor switch protein FliN
VSDDLLKPEEIEALLKASTGGAGTEPKPSGAASAGRASAAGARPGDSSAPGAGKPVQPAGSPRSGSSASAKEQKTKSPTERLLEQAEAGLAAAVAPTLQSQAGPAIPAELGNAVPFQFESLDQIAALGKDGIGLSALQDVELDLRIELGRTVLLIEEVLQLKSGSVVPLNKLAGDPVDILVNGRLIARGEVLVLNDNFCVRVAELVAPTL